MSNSKTRIVSLGIMAAGTALLGCGLWLIRLDRQRQAPWPGGPAGWEAPPWLMVTTLSGGMALVAMGLKSLILSLRDVYVPTWLGLLIFFAALTLMCGGLAAYTLLR